VGAVALGSLAWWLGHRKREGKPALLDIGLFASKYFRLGITSQTLQQISLGGLMIALPIYLQMVLEYDAMEAGLSIAPLSLTMFAVALVAARKAGDRSPSKIIRAGFLLLVVGVAVLIPIVPRADSGWAMAAPLVIAGAGLGLLVSQLNNYTLSPIEEERVSEAAGVNSAGGSFGLAFGLAFAPDRVARPPRRGAARPPERLPHETATRPRAVGGRRRAAHRLRSAGAAAICHRPAMPTDQYHEPPDELGEEARTFARVIASLQEEAEAIGWYEQRMSIETNDEARGIMEHAQREEFLHFSMDLEFLARRKEKWRIALQQILFKEGDIVDLAERAEDEVEE
jgi:hypothetical protein